VNNLCKVLCVALLAVPAGAMAADEMGCDSVNWGQEVLAKFPNAQKGCQGVTMKNGEAYAHYIAEIVKTDGDTVTVHLLDKEKKGLSEVQFVPNANQKITVNGKETRYQDLKKGTKLDLYIQHSRWGLYSDPDSTPMQILSRRDL
jgi:hypothetical protein